MTASVVVPDTHTLYWHITGSDRMSRPAREVFARAAAGECVLALSPIVLAELYWLLGKQGAGMAFNGVMHRFRASPAYAFEPLTFEDLAALPAWEEIPEMHDRLIAIQAARLGATLVTRDPALQACNRIQCLW